MPHSSVQRRIHFIGICGVAMSALAIAFKKRGWRVTGSDAGFFPPISTHLKENGIEFYPGWHPEKMVAGGAPDLVVVGNVASSINPEWLSVQEHTLPYRSYPELVADHFVKKNSIVCAGTYGKTTTSALLSWILTEAEFDPSYMFGGLVSERTDFPSANLGTSDWSVLEGDEYKSSRWDNRPKFAHYSPTHLLLTAAIWDHADIYPTEASYLEAFQQLVAGVPKDGHMVACTDTEQVRRLSALAPKRLSTYGKKQDADYRYTDVRQTADGIAFEIKYGANIYRIQSPMLGDYQAENITGAFAMAHTIGIAPEQIIEAVKRFPGMKRRLEKRYEGIGTIFDDIAHSPAKAASTLATLRSIYPKQKIIAVFEPNTGNRRQAALPGYDYAFRDADHVLVPHLTKVKHDPRDSEQALESRELSAAIAKTHPHVRAIDDDDALVETLAAEANPGDVIVFLGSHGFRGMIEKMIMKFQTSQNNSL